MNRVRALKVAMQLSFRILLGMTFLFAVVSCGGDDQDAPPSEPPNAAQNLWPERDVVFVECMATAARVAYSPVNEVAPMLCDALLSDSFEHMPEFGNNVLKVFKRRFSDAEADNVDVLIVFAGTRKTDFGDLLRDLQSQIPVDYTNLYGAEHQNVLALSGEEEVGAGFDSRWGIQASTVKDAIESIKDESEVLELEPAMTISVVGHSLGAATATRAAFDLNRSMEGQRIVVWSFNPPRIGNSAFAESYVDSLKTCEFTDEGCFMIRQFTRTGDPIHGLPLLLSHPVWNTDQEADVRMNTGEPAEQELDYCPHYHGPRASTINLADNHDLDSWRMDVYEMPPEHFSCMFL